MKVYNFGNSADKEVKLSPLLIDMLNRPKSSYKPVLNLKNIDKAVLGSTYSDSVKLLSDELNKTRQEQGTIGRLWDGFKNLTNIGAGSKKAENAIKLLKQGKIDEKTAREKLENYKDGQKVCLDVIADMLSSIIAVGAFAAAVPTGGMSLAAGLGLSTITAAVLKAGIKGIESKLNGREYNGSNLLYDTATGAVNGLFAPITNGLGSSLTKTIACKFGLEVSESFVSQGAKTTLKSLIVNQSIDVFGGTLKQRALALGAGMAVDGALGGAADNTVRAVLNGEDKKGIAQSALNGFIGGFIAAPVIGGGMRLAGKAGRKIGKKIFKNNMPDSDINAPGRPKPNTLDTDADSAPPRVKPDTPDTSAKPHADINDTANAPVKPKMKFSPDVTDNLRKQLKDIPQGRNERIKFLTKFFQTDLETGAQKPFRPGSFDEKIGLEAIERLSAYSSDDLAVVLEHSLKFSESSNRSTIPVWGLDADINVYKNIKKRNIYELIAKRKAAQSWDNIDPVYLGGLDDVSYKRVYNLIQKIGIDDNSVRIDSIAQFVLKTDPDTIEYMSAHNLFDAENMTSFQYNRSYFTKGKVLEFFEGIDAETIMRMHKRGLLKEIPGRESLQFQDVIRLANSLSDEEWKSVSKRGLLTLKTNKERFLDAGEICDLARLNDDIYSRVKSRGLTDKVGYLTWNIKTLAELDDADWKKIIDRKIEIDKVNIREKKDLIKLLSISDKDWKTAQKRGLTFENDDDYKLLELSAENWDNIVKRNLNAKNSKTNYNIYDTESQIRLSKLTDAEFETAKERGLIKELGYSSSPAFSEESLMLSKLNDSSYELYFKRGIDKLGDLWEIEIKQDLLNMTDEQYRRFIDDIFPVIKKCREYGTDRWNPYANKTFDINKYYKLAYLNKKEYELAKQFAGLEYFGICNSEQFSADEICRIIKLPSDRIERLTRILSSSTDSGHYNKKSLLQFLEFDSDTYNKIIKAQECLSVYQIEDYMNKDMLIDVINYKSLAENKNIIIKVNNSKLSQNAKDELVNRLLGFTKNDYSNMTLRQKLNCLAILQEAQTSAIFDGEEIGYLNLDNEILNLQNSIKHVITVTDVPKEDAVKMMRGFFANNNPELDKLLSNTDFGRYGKNGLPLTYSRNKFIEDLSGLLQNLSTEEQTAITKKLGIVLIKNDGIITGYDGIINLNALSDSGIEGRVLKAASKFIKENAVNTGNKKLDDALNSLIKGMPEFINIIGKQQHDTHDFSLDIHILSVLKEAMANPNYKNLDGSEKFCLKFAAIMHDIAKQEGIKDEGHAALCALYARDILNKDAVTMPEEIKDRIYELIKNHHWLKDYNTGSIDAEHTAALFRREGDIAAAQILAEADLKGVKQDGSFYKEHGSALSRASQTPIEDALNKIDSHGQIFYTSRIIDNSKIPVIEYNGKKYKVINFNELTGDADLSKFGFEPGTTADNLRLFIHTVNSEKINNLENVIFLSDPANQGFLCASYVSAKNHPTYGGNKFGVSLASENVNIANAAPNNQGSGRGKNLLHFINIITDSNAEDAYRTLIPDCIKRELNITGSEYSMLFKIIQKYKYASQLDNIDSIRIGNKTFSGKQIKQAVSNADDLMMIRHSSKHNEANLYVPKTNAVIAKAESIEELPQKLLDFAERHNLPIYILGK